MEIIADFHIHSRFARATSKDITLQNLEKWARVKGLGILGTGDFQHPEWNEEIKNELKEDDKGILWSKTGFPFVWQTELSFMYSQNGRGRAVHLLVLAPDGNTADKIIEYLKGKGRIDYDGRPIFGINCRQFIKEIKEIDGRIELIPAHCMTSWFGIFGSERGFNSLEEAFGEQAGHIYAIESGMSANPEMLWRFREKVNVVSFSDSHSCWPWRIGREATIFEIDNLSYDNVINAIRSGNGLKATIETPPEYGKYHWDGHRNCGFSCNFEESRKLNGKCPKCGKPMTIGVEYRVEEIAKESKGWTPENVKKFYELVPLHELIALAFGIKMESKKAWEVYNILIEKFGNEMKVLMNASKMDLEYAKTDEKLIEFILLSREGKLKVKPGFDGEYGKLIMPEKQTKL